MLVGGIGRGLNSSVVPIFDRCVGEYRPDWVSRNGQ